MKCFVINLDRSRDRLAHVVTEFEKIGIAFQRVSAVDGRTLVDMPKYAPHLRTAEVACFLSHKKCWTAIADGTDDYAAVFEDDVVMDCQAAGLLSDENWVPVDADVVKVETFLNKTIVGIRPVVSHRGFSIVRLYGDHPGTSGYVISRMAARRFLAATAEIKCPVDGFLFGSEHQASAVKTVYQTAPALCIQSMFLKSRANMLKSEIAPERCEPSVVARKPSKKGLAQKLVAEIRRTARNLVLAASMRRAKAIPFNSLKS